jgi:hypothetical protein
MSGRMLGGGLGVIAMLVTLIWALGAGMAPLQALGRAVVALVVLFLVGLMLGRAMADTVGGEVDSAGKSEKKGDSGRITP